jgi:hypothetical protein
LKSIAIKKTGRAGEFAAYVKASPEELATKFLHADFQTGIRTSEKKRAEELDKDPSKFSAEEQEEIRDTQNRRLGLRRGVQHTALTASWNGESLPRMMSRGGKHAEAFLNDFIRDGLDEGILQPSKIGKNNLAIQITKSPCDQKCKPLLLALAEETNASVHLEIVGLYHGEQEKRDPEGNKVKNDKGSYVQKSRSEKVQERQVQINVLKELRAKGFTLSTLDVEKIIASHYDGMELDAAERASIETKTRRLKVYIDQINSDAMAVEGETGGN